MIDREDILRQIELHTKMGATAKVALLERRLCGESEPDTKSSTAFMFSQVPEDESDQIKIKQETNVGLGMYKMRKQGMSWKEISEAWNQKQPWFTVKKFCKDNDLDYKELSQ